MPKMKTHRGAAKRFKLTGSGKVKFKHANMQHNFMNQTKKNKKSLIKAGIMVEADARKVRRMLNGG
jgi:large subunit ribosomal protein L35